MNPSMPASAMKTAPTFMGPGGAAWKWTKQYDAAKDSIDVTATLGAWLVHCPGAHAFWDWYMVSVVHLRPIVGESKPAALEYPEAAYEFSIYALDPTHPVPEPDGSNLDKAPLRPLLPLNVATQFHGVTDEQAIGMCEGAAMAIVAGRISPDSDFRYAWKQLIKNSAEHLALGGHPKVMA